MSIISKARDKVSRRLSGESKSESSPPSHSGSTEESKTDAPESCYRSLAAYAAECDNFVQEVNKTETQLSELQSLHQRALSTATTSDAARHIDDASRKVTQQFRGLIVRLQTLKPDAQSGRAGLAAHFARAEKRLRDTMLRHTQIERDRREAQRAALKRQYRVIKPEATDNELDAAVSGVDPQQQQMFAQALLRGEDRTITARSALNAVDDRHIAIERIEGQLIELADLFHLLGENVLQQEVPVRIIEQEAEVTKENVEFAAVELGEAAETAKAARRKKWTCFWIIVVVIIVVIAGVAIVAALAG